MEVHYLTPLVVTPIPRDTPAPYLNRKADKVQLVEPFVVQVGHRGKTYTITVPKGYINDCASIPKIFHRIWHPMTTESWWAATVHDRIYSHLHHTYSKEFADELLRTMIEHDGGSKWMQWCFYHAVRLNFNGGGWNK